MLTFSSLPPLDIENFLFSFIFNKLTDILFKKFMPTFGSVCGGWSKMYKMGEEIPTTI